jgi:hypothetical protein
MIFSMETSDFGPILISERPKHPPVEPPLRRRRRKPQVRRTAAIIVVGVVAAILLVRIVGTAVRPLVVSVQAGRDVRRLETQRQLQEQRRSRLLERIAYLRTPAGVEQEARRQGWVREGETAIQIVRPEKGVRPSASGVRPSALGVRR